MMESFAARRFQPRHDLLTTTVNGEVMILDVEAGRYFAMDRIGTRIFDLLQGGASVDGVIASLEREYDVEAATCRRDVEAYILSLLDRQLIVASQISDGGDAGSGAEQKQAG